VRRPRPTRCQLLALGLVLPLTLAAGCAEGGDTGNGDRDSEGGTLGSAAQPVQEAVLTSPATVFDVTTIFVPAGTPIRFTYRNEHEGVPHNFHVTGDGVDAMTTLRSGPDVQEVTATFPEAGDFDYICDVHPSMKGVVRAV